MQLDVLKLVWIWQLCKKVLGHANIQTTINIYGDIFDYHQKNQMHKYTEYMDKMNEKYEKILENNRIKE